jgi:hypothetical protein
MWDTRRDRPEQNHRKCELFGALRVIILVVLVLGGWYGRGRWFAGPRILRRSTHPDLAALGDVFRSAATVLHRKQ